MLRKNSIIMDEFIAGTCESMCPTSEIEWRTRERLLHYFEVLDPGSKTKNPDRKRVVKSFSRSAAGIRTPKPLELRTFKALKLTVEYLLTKVMEDKRKPFPFIYDFIFDRLRAVRQEIVIQNMNCEQTIELLEPITMFLAFSSYRLCGYPIAEFDPKICSQHLQECLKKLLSYYESCNYVSNRRYFIESLYLLYNIGCPEALARAVSLDRRIRQNPLVEHSLKISISCFCDDNYRAIRLIDDLPHILHCIAMLKIPKIRRKILETFSHGYHSKTLSVSLLWLKNLLLYDQMEHLINDCEYYGISVRVETDQWRAVFNKLEFKENAEAASPRYSSKAEDKLKDAYLPDILFFKDFIQDEQK